MCQLRVSRKSKRPAAQNVGLKQKGSAVHETPNQLVVASETTALSSLMTPSSKQPKRQKATLRVTQEAWEAKAEQQEVWLFEPSWVPHRKQGRRKTERQQREMRGLYRPTHRKHGRWKVNPIEVQSP